MSSLAAQRGRGVQPGARRPSRTRNDEVDELDLRLLKMLAKDPKASIRSLASKLGVAPSTAHSRLTSLFDRGIVKSFTILVDPEKIGYSITAIILFQADVSRIEDLEKHLSAIHNVIAVYDITGDYDVLAIARFRNMGELDTFIKSVNKLPYVRRTVTSIALRVIKEDPSSPLHIL